MPDQQKNFCHREEERSDDVVISIKKHHLF